MSDFAPTTARRLADRGQLSDEVTDYVREQIVSGRLLPGTRVLAESIAQELGVSATPAREGLLALRVEGFLNLEPRKGFVVAPLAGSDIRDVFTAIALLTGEEAAKVASWATPDDLKPMREVLARLTAFLEADRYAEAELCTREIYRELHKLANAPKISSMVMLLAKYAWRGFVVEFREEATAQIALYTAILDRLEAGDPEGARRAVDAQLRHVAELHARRYDSHSSEAG